MRCTNFLCGCNGYVTCRECCHQPQSTCCYQPQPIPYTTVRTIYVQPTDTTPSTPTLPTGLNVTYIGRGINSAVAGDTLVPFTTFTNVYGTDAVTASGNTLTFNQAGVYEILYTNLYNNTGTTAGTAQLVIGGTPVPTTRVYMPQGEGAGTATYIFNAEAGQTLQIALTDTADITPLTNYIAVKKLS